MDDLSHSIIIADASPLISFLKIQRFDLLSVFQKQLVCTDFVRSEVRQQKEDLDRLIARSLITEVRIELPEHLEIIEELYAQGLGRGEASSIVFAQATEGTLLIDDKRAVKTAFERGLAIISTAEIMLANIQQNRLSLEEADNFIGQWRAMGEFPVKVASFQELF